MRKHPFLVTAERLESHDTDAVRDALDLDWDLFANAAAALRELAGLEAKPIPDIDSGVRRPVGRYVAEAAAARVLEDFAESVSGGPLPADGEQ